MLRRSVALLLALLFAAPFAGTIARAEDRPVSQGEMRAGDVVRAQETLARLGYPVGPIDGIVGPRTRQATRQFQRDRGLALTEAFDQPTLNALGLPGRAYVADEHPRPSPATRPVPSEQMPIGQREPIAGQPGIERPDARRPGLTRREIGGVAPGRFQGGEGLAPGRFDGGTVGSRPGARSADPRPGLGQ